MTLHKLAQFGLLSAGVGALLTGCFGTAKECDTATGAGCETGIEGDADTDTDTDTDSDSDSDSDSDVVFDAYAMAISVVVGYDGTGIVAYTSPDGSANEAFGIVTMYEEAYFDAGDERYKCEDYYSVTENGVDSLQVDGIWNGWDISLLYLGAGENPCENFDSAIWGSDTPVDVIEATALGVGVGPMSSDHQATLKTWIEGAGYSWDDDFASYWLSYHLGLYDAETGALAGSEIGYSWVFEADENMQLISGSNCLPEGLQCADISQASETPSNVVLNTGSYYLPYTSNLF